jgi:uncharacterized repeat protein (TIGR01451 family)
MLGPLFRSLKWPGAVFPAALVCALFMSAASGALAQEADLDIVKSGPASAAANTNVSYTLSVNNSGPDNATSATLTDPIPAGMTFVSLSSPAGWTCSTPAVGAGGTVTCSNPSFVAGGTGNFALTVLIPAATPPGTFFTNIATVASSTFDPNDENNSSTAATLVAGGSSADLAIAKTGPATVQPGQNIVYSIQALNAGPDAATLVQISDPLPAGTTFVSLASPAGWTCSTPAVGTGGTVNCSIGSLASGTGGTFTLTANVPAGTPQGTPFDNIATISSATLDPTPDNNSATTGAVTVGAVPDLAIAKSHSGNPTQGQTGFTYTITVTNAGTVSTTGTTTVQDALPAGLTATAINGAGWSCTLATLTCTRADALAANAAYPVITLTVNVAANAPSNLTNTAIVSNPSDTNAANDTATDPTTVTVTPAAAPDVAIAKSHSGNATLGQTGFAYTITVSNVGNGSSSGIVTVTDILPAKLTATAIGGPGWTCSLGAAPSCTRSDALAPGATYPAITLTVNVASDAPATITNTATVSGGGDANPANNTATDQTTIRPRSDPTKDPDVVGLVNAQMATAQRLANAQTSNFNERLEALHDDNTGDQFGLRFGGTEQDSCNLPGVSMPLDPFDPKCRKQMSEASATDAFAYAPNGKPVYKAEAPKPQPAARRDYAFWSSGYVSFGSADPTAPRSGIDFNTSGVSAGVDYRLGRNFIAGFGVGYGRDSTRIGERGTHSDAQAYNVAAYGSYRPFRNFFIDGLAGYGAMRFNSQRFVVDDAALVYGARNGSQLFGSLTAAYQFRWQQMMVSPYARINAAWLTLGAFTETGGFGGALAYSSQSANFYTSVLGLRGRYTFLTDWGSIAPRLRIEYNHDFAGSSAIFLQYADLIGPIYSLTTTPASRDRATFGAGSDVMFGDAHRIGIDYQYDADFLGAAWHRFKVRWDSRFSAR